MKEETKKSKESSSLGGQVRWVFGVVLGLAITYLVVSSFIKSLNSFEYEGLTFTREKFDQLNLYRYSYNAIVPVTGAAINVQRPVDLYLRVDPRQNQVPIGGSEIELPRDKTVYLATLGEGLVGCPYSTVGVASLSGFLTQNGFKVKGATLDEQEAIDNNIQFASCKNNPESPVIEMKGGPETKITLSERCYIIEVANCEVIPAVEKFEVQMILDAKERFG